MKSKSVSSPKMVLRSCPMNRAQLETSGKPDLRDHSLIRISVAYN